MSTHPSRRRALSLAVSAMTLGLAQQGSLLHAASRSSSLQIAEANAAASYPSRPVTLIVPWPAAGATDITMRILASGMERALGQPVIVRNRPGAGGTLVAPALREARPDGYTIGQIPVTVYRHSLMRRVEWDPIRDISPIVQVSGTTFGLLVPAKSPFQSVPDLINWAREQPGMLSMGSTGVGTTPHLAVEEIFSMLGIQYIHVPFRGTVDQLQALSTGQLMAGVSSTGFAPWVDQGSLRLLAVFSADRSKRWPDVPTMRELGFRQAVYSSPWGVGAPAGTPAAVVGRLASAIQEAAFDPAHVKALREYDQFLDFLPTVEYERAILEALANERTLLRRMGLLAEQVVSQ